MIATVWQSLSATEPSPESASEVQHFADLAHGAGKRIADLCDELTGAAAAKLAET